jgi:Icc-related predicted phosphoesterase
MYEFEYPVSDGLDSLTIFGTPYCSIFGNWAFMINDDALDKKFSQIPEGVDILVSHDSPNIGKIGAILEGVWKNDTTGNKILAKHIERVHPKLFVSGHFHSGNHDVQKIGNTYAANVSYINEDYYPTYPILKISYNEETRNFFE